MSETATVPRLIKASHWSKYHSWPSPAGLRWLIFRADENGFRKVIRKVGASVLVDEQEFFQWCKEQDEAAKREGR